MKKHTLLFLLASTLIAGGCQSLEPFFAQPDVSFETVSFRDMSLSEGTFIFSFRVHNPNPMAIRIGAVGYDLRIDGRQTAKGTIERGVRVPAAGTGSVDVPVTVSFLDFLQNASAIAGRDAVGYALSGSFDIMGFKLPYETRGSLPVPKVPQISLETVEIGNIDFSGTDLNFILKLANPNPFRVAPDGLDYTVDLAGIRFLSGRTENIGSVAANGAARITIPARIDFIGLGRTAMRLLDNPSAPYRLSGHLRFKRPDAGQQAIAFDNSGQVSLAR